MKLATLRDGQLIVVSRDLSRFVSAASVAGSMEETLKHWTDVEPRLTWIYDRLNEGQADGAKPFHPQLAAPPVPRAPQWLDASAFETHARRLEQAWKLPPADYKQNPMMYQGNSDDFIGATDDIEAPSVSDGIDFEGEIGVIVDDVPMGCPRDQALAHVRLLVLINDVSLRAHSMREMKTGFGWVQAKPCTSFGPVAVTPDELGPAWVGGRVELDLYCSRNGALLGHPNGREMSFGFDQLIAYAAYSRRLSAGTIIGSGTFANADPSVGVACIAECRAIESINQGAPSTAFLQHGERIRIEMFSANNQSLFGAINQCVIAISRDQAKLNLS